MFTSDVLNDKCFRQMKHARLWKNAILWAISWREISPLVVIFKKKNDQTSWRTTRRSFKHISQIVCISDSECCPFFHEIWATQSPLKIHWYTCMSFETCWSRLIYTEVSSHQSIVINMFVVTMAWRCISSWRRHRHLLTKIRYGQLSFSCDRN